MKIVFLDIDGVLCTDRSVVEQKLPFPDGFHIPFREGWDRLDKECIKYLNEITHKSGAKIVISSSWRLSCYTDEEFGYLKRYLILEGVSADIIGKTPSHYNIYNNWANSKDRIRTRYEEIQEWLNKNKVDSFVILDDIRDMGHLKSHHVYTLEPVGIQSDDVRRALEILNASNM